MTSKHSAGGFARAAALPPDRRRLIASAAARARWGGARSPDGMTFVYVIGPADGPLKVGVARDPVWRRGALQVGSHSELIIHAAIAVDLSLAKAVEAYAHWLLGEAAAGGEWFKTTAPIAEKAVADALVAVTAGERAPKRPKKVTARVKRPKMIFELTDADREALEQLRIAVGLRSHAETLRSLIREARQHVRPAHVQKISKREEG